MKKLVSFMLAAAMMITMSACAGSGSSTTATTAGGTSATTAVSLTTNAAAGEEVVIGCLQDITGPTSTLGKMVEVGAKWAIDEINANGTLKGKTIKMITYDTRGDVNEAINAFTRACTTDKVCAI